MDLLHEMFDVVAHDLHVVMACCNTAVLCAGMRWQF